MAEETATDGSSNTIVIGESGGDAEGELPADRRRDDAPPQDTEPDETPPSGGTGFPPITDGTSNTITAEDLGQTPGNGPAGARPHRTGFPTPDDPAPSGLRRAEDIDPAQGAPGEGADGSTAPPEPPGVVVEPPDDVAGATPEVPFEPKGDAAGGGPPPGPIDESLDRLLDQELENTDIPLPGRDTGNQTEPEAEAEPGPKASPDVPPLPGEVPPGGADLVDLPPPGAPPTDDAAAPLDVPQVGQVIRPDAEGVVGGVTEPDGQQQFLLDTNADGLLDTLVEGVPVGDGTFKVVEASRLDEALSPEDLGRESEGGTEPPEPSAEPPTAEGAPDVPPSPGEVPPGGAQPVDLPPTGEVPPEPAAEAPPPVAPPVHGLPDPPASDPPAAEVDLPPELYDEPPPYATGSGAQPVEAPPEPAAEPADDAAVDALVPAASFDLDTDDSADEALEVTAEDGDDPGLLEQVAEAMGGVWDDAKDVVT